jgi:CheY-like chemotaxis protein
MTIRTVAELRLALRDMSPEMEVVLLAEDEKHTRYITSVMTHNWGKSQATQVVGVMIR